MPIAINGRFLGQRVTGVQRFASEITRALEGRPPRRPIPGTTEA